MKLSRVIVLLSICAASLCMLGCAVFDGERPHGGVKVVVGQPNYVIVAEAPPAPRIVEHRPAPPAGEYIWIEGYYAWTGRQYAWEPGRWEVPPQANVIWMEPRYERDERGYRYTPGHWQPHDREESHEKQKPDRR